MAAGGVKRGLWGQKILMIDAFLEMGHGARLKCDGNLGVPGKGA